MSHKLTVTQQFGAYNVGDDITDPEEVAKVSASHPAFVVRSAAGNRPDADPPSVKVPAKPSKA